jgi:hypothetical protein
LPPRLLLRDERPEDRLLLDERELDRARDELPDERDRTWLLLRLRGADRAVERLRYERCGVLRARLLLRDW